MRGNKKKRRKKRKRTIGPGGLWGDPSDPIGGQRVAHIHANALVDYLEG
jgi:hypothetical protein